MKLQDIKNVIFLILEEDKYKIKLQQIEKESRELTEPLKNINEEI